MSIVSEKILGLLSQQYVHEMRNHLIYRNLGVLADKIGMTGSSGFFHSQAQDELGHAEKVYKFIADRNETFSTDLAITPEKIPGEPLKWFPFAMALELETTKMLKEIAIQAQAENDLQTFYWAGDLIQEQTEEENIFQTILDRIAVRLQGEAPTGEVLHDLDIWIGGLK